MSVPPRVTCRGCGADLGEAVLTRTAAGRWGWRISAAAFDHTCPKPPDQEETTAS